MASGGKAALQAFIKMSGSIGKLYKRPFTVCVEGNIGSGKTTFLSHFKKYDNVTVLEEPVELWRDVSGTNLLELMYSEPSRFAFLFQSYVQLTMLQLHTCKTPSPYKIMERSVYSAMCFVEHLKRRNVLRNVEVTILEDWYDWCLKNANIETNLIVYLRTTPEIVYERMKRRGRKEENAVSLEYLKQIHQIHDDWLYHQTLKPVPSPVITINGDRELHEMVEEFDKCKNEIFSKVIDDNDVNNTIITVSTNRVLPEIKAGISD
ncbi:deoxynucleoside kinase-like isoform X1 [Pogonomyrmex barbatus]|uniref:Deoxynucleoside kinase-like isoform X1 n=2 Tax=Pogonomyrmex barbatus TaxID=144034 RepID=A0A6I9VW14_9HYME|nr:deoxynucleoside kinase-like isoform X1 [Pogonomyrmex barbatus]